VKALIKQKFFKNHYIKKINGKVIWGINLFRNVIHLYESEEKLASDNHDYWNRDYSNPILAQDAHWKNKGIFENQQRWYRLGKEHLDLLLQYSSILNLSFPVKQILEWGSGGGANAVHFAPLTEKFIGVDVTSESLDECNRQVLKSGFNNFYPILINASTPESVLDHRINNIDLFICTYVYEQFPSPTYGLTVLKLANKILKNGGIAFVHIRYNDGKKGFKSKRWGYKFHPYNMTTYTLEEFWEESKDLGFEPLGIYLKPDQPLVRDKWYAYYFLKKKKSI